MGTNLNDRKTTKPLFFLVCSVSAFHASASLAASQASIDGGDFQTMQPPITIIQRGNANSAAIVDQGVLSDSAVMQTGFYNRTAIIQFGNDKNAFNDKYAYLEQPGQFNRAMIVQVGTTAQDIQFIDTQQGTGLSSINYKFSLQSSVNDPDPIAQQFARLTFDEAKTVASNFIFAPEVSRVNVGILEDITLHFSSLLESRLDQTRFGSCSKSAVETKNAKSSDPNCSTAPFFAALSYGSADRDSTLGMLGYEQNIVSATVGADFQVNSLARLGVALNFADSDSDIHQNFGSVSATSYQIGGFGSIAQDRYYLDLIATLGKVDFSSDRFGGATKVRADTDGWSYSGRLQGGYFFGDERFRFGPLLSTGYSKGTVDSYWEKGSPILTQYIEQQDRERFVASLGAALDRRDQLGGYPVQSYLKLELERDFGIGRQDLLESRFAFSPFVVMTPLDDVAEDTYGRISGGFSLAVNRQVQLSLAGTTLIGADRQDRYDLYGGVSVTF